MRAVAFLLLFSVCGITFGAQEDETPPTAPQEVSVGLEVIGYHPRFSKSWFESTTGELREIYEDLLRFKVLEPKEHAEKEFELLLPTRGGTYLSPTVEYQERIVVQLDSTAFSGLLSNPQPEYRPSRSPMIERAIHSALVERKKTTVPSERPAP